MPKILRLSAVAVLIAALIFPDPAMAFYHSRHRPYHLTAKSAILWDPVHNDRLFNFYPEREVFPASTTKVLTAILVLEHLSLDQYVTVSQHATQVPRSKLGLRAGESYRVRDLLYGLILKSANDAAVALAEAVGGGSEARFVDMMNERARQIGAVHSHFANPHGLPTREAQYTTANDMALIFTQALKNDFFRQAITFKYRVIYSENGHRYFFKSHNRTLFLNWKNHIFGKTGYTIEAQSCFVGYIPRGNDILLLAVFGCKNRWTDMKFIIEHYGHIAL